MEMKEGNPGPGMEVATAFLETSLGTGLAVSFPARATTVADLKRMVSDEHATAFPSIGQITVESFKVRRRGTLYHLTDSMLVQAAFHGIKGTWYLQVDVVPHSTPAAHKDAKCATDDTDTDMLHHVLCDTQRNVAIDGCMPLLPQDAASQGAGNLALPDTPSMKHHFDVHVAPCASEGTPLVPATSLSKCSSVQAGGYAMPGQNSEPDVAAQEDDGPVRRQQIQEPRGKKHFREENQKHQEIADNCVGGLTSRVCSRQDDQNKRRHLLKDEHSEQYSKSKGICARVDGFLNEVDVSSVGTEDVAVHSSDDEIPKNEGASDNSQNHGKGLDFLGRKEEAVQIRPADELESSVELCGHGTKSVTNNTEPNSENPALCFSVNENDSTTSTEKHADAGVAREKLVEQQGHLDNSTEGSGEKHDGSTKRCDTVSATAEGLFDLFTPKYALSEKTVNSSTLKTYHNGEVCNTGSHKKGTDLPPCVGTLKEVTNSVEREAMVHKGEEKDGERSSKGTDLPPCAESMKENKSPKLTCTAGDGTTVQRMQSEDSLQSDQCKFSTLEAIESDLAKPCQNAGKCPEGTPKKEGTKVPLDYVTDNSDPHGACNIPDTPKDPASNDLKESRDVEATSTDGTEQEEWVQRRRQRIGVRKVRMSRAMKMYGFR